MSHRDNPPPRRDAPVPREPPPGRRTPHAGCLERPPRKAVALRYDGQGAPRVTAKGQGFVAEEILARARAHDIPLHADAALVTLLSRIDLGEEIPETLYRAVAQVLAFAYLLSGKLPPRREGEK